MSIAVLCPTCQARVSAPDSAAGKTVKCPKCKQPMVIPGGPAESAGGSPFDFTAPAPPPPPSRPVATGGRKPPRPAAEQPMDLDDDEPAPPRKPGRGPARRRDEDEDDDRPRGRGRKPAKGGPPLGLIIGIAAVVGLLVIGGASLGVYYAFFSKSDDGTADAGGGGGGGGGGSASSKAAVPSGWKEFTATADGFKAYFPAEPRSRPDTGPGDLRVKATIYMAANPQSKQIAVAAVFKLSDIPAAERDGIVDRVIRESAKEDGGKEVSRRSATLGGRPATEVVMEMPSAGKGDERPQLVARVMKTESRVYMVGVGGMAGKVPDDVVKGFFDNFEMLSPGSGSGNTADGSKNRGGSSAEPKVWLREEFRQAILGKTPEQVIAAVGKPDSTQDSSGDQSWYYRKRTKDPVTGKLDSVAQVIFERGVVVRVNY